MWMRQFSRTSYKKEDVERFLAQLSREIKKQFNRKTKVELIIVGGASVILNYGFRKTTMDIDAYISAGTSIKVAIYKIAEDNNISEEWLNSDFLKTSSFTHKLTEVSKYYKTYNQVLDVRTISDEYLVAMKLEAFRKYKYDLSDAFYVIKAMKGSQSDNVDKVKKAYNYLYDKKLDGEKLKFLNGISSGKINESQIRDYEEVNSNVIKNLDTKKSVSKDNLDKIMGSVEKLIKKEQ